MAEKRERESTSVEEAEVREAGLREELNEASARLQKAASLRSSRASQHSLRESGAGQIPSVRGSGVQPDGTDLRVETLQQRQADVQ
eukprot:10256862-Alexandrium_andersonii.AAC.1